ncbi:hypothetical protein O181_008012 [Austropuccinia psidii MF-1]|uniref:Uncharacterized protein n=1 Tax=Austropuccinia psidii MF-1 TaxID=1389203 RepID=A0A9Q3GJ13_9BASI|nr:hypothetical protein [Austropuccinia psidii MF-1]
MVELPYFPRFEWYFLVIDSPKGEYLILGFEFLNNLNPSIDKRKGLIRFNTDYKDSSDSLFPPRNVYSTAITHEFLVGDSRTPSLATFLNIPYLNFPHSFLLSINEDFKEIIYGGEYYSISSLHVSHGNSNLPPSFYHDSLEELCDKEEELEEIENLMKFFPSAYDHYSDVFCKVKEEKLNPHYSFDHFIKLEGSLP